MGQPQEEIATLLVSQVYSNSLYMPYRSFNSSTEKATGVSTSTIGFLTMIKSSMNTIKSLGMAVLKMISTILFLVVRRDIITK